MTLANCRGLGLGLAGALLAVCALAQAATPPDQEIRATTEQLRTEIKAHQAEYKANSDKFYAVVDRIVVPRFDINYIGKLVLGRTWRTATEPQRQRFLAAFKNGLVHSYASALLDYADTTKEDWKPVQMAANAREATVRVDIVRANAPPLPIAFSTHLVNEQWKVYDVAVENVSLASNFRAQYAAEIKTNGLDSLITRLEGGGKPLPADKPIKAK